MKRIVSVSAVCVAIALFLGTTVFAAAPGGAPTEEKGEAKAAVKETAPSPTATYIGFSVPIFSPLFAKFPVATVNDEPILLQELVTTIASAHEQMGEGKAAGRKNFDKVLHRLINIKLILLEAVNMGMDELPEMKKTMADYSESHLREMLKKRAIREVEPDEKVVEELYRAAVKEWKIRSLKFEKEEDAKAFVKEIEKGGDFNAVADKLLKSGKAEGGKEGEYVKLDALLPQVAGPLSAMKKVGALTPVIPIGPSFTVVRLEEFRYPAGNADAREAAYKQARIRNQQAALLKYNDALIKKYAKINKVLLKKLDLEAPKPGIEKLSKDKRVVAQVKGEKPITVADLVEGIQMKFFHGMKSAILEKKVNPLIVPELNEKLTRLVFTKEAKLLGIDKSEEYRKDVIDYRDSMVFGAFAQKVMTPEVKITEDEIKAYYQEHIAEYTAPAIAKVGGIVFTKKANAEAAIDKLKKGTDFQWVKNNAEGQVDKEKGEALLEFEGKLLVLNNFPEQMQKMFAGAKQGDIRLYQSPDGFFYAILVQDLFPAKASPLEEERKPITKILFGQKLNQAVEEWGEKLKKAYTIKVFVTDVGK